MSSALVFRHKAVDDFVAAIAGNRGPLFRLWISTAGPLILAEANISLGAATLRLCFCAAFNARRKSGYPPGV